MFFYTSLFVANLIVAFVLLWLYKPIMNAGRVVYRAILPSSKSNPASYLKQKVLLTTVNDTATPWGWKSSDTPRSMARRHAAQPSERDPRGWPGKGHDVGGRQTHRNTNVNKAVPRPADKSMQNIGWPYREEKLSSYGKANTVKRKATPKRTNLKTASKPWGW
jgi:hypothetical protein